MEESLLPRRPQMLTTKDDSGGKEEGAGLFLLVPPAAEEDGAAPRNNNDNNDLFLLDLDIGFDAAVGPWYEHRKPDALSNIPATQWALFITSLRAINQAYHRKTGRRGWSLFAMWCLCFLLWLIGLVDLLAGKNLWNEHVSVHSVGFLAGFVFSSYMVFVFPCRMWHERARPLETARAQKRALMEAMAQDFGACGYRVEYYHDATVLPQDEQQHPKESARFYRRLDSDTMSSLPGALV